MELGIEDAPAYRARQSMVAFIAEIDRPDLLDDALLVATELVANAVRHAPGPLQLRASYSTGRLRIEITDDSPFFPRMRDAAPEDESGRGISIISTLTDLWGFDRTSQGKTVWAELV